MSLYSQPQPSLIEIPFPPIPLEDYKLIEQWSTYIGGIEAFMFIFITDCFKKDYVEYLGADSMLALVIEGLPPQQLTIDFRTYGADQLCRQMQKLEAHFKLHGIQYSMLEELFQNHVLAQVSLTTTGILLKLCKEQSMKTIKPFTLCVRELKPIFQQYYGIDEMNHPDLYHAALIDILDNVIVKDEVGNIPSFELTAGLARFGIPLANVNLVRQLASQFYHQTMQAYEEYFTACCEFNQVSVSYEFIDSENVIFVFTLTDSFAVHVQPLLDAINTAKDNDVQIPYHYLTFIENVRRAGGLLVDSGYN